MPAYLLTALKPMFKARLTAALTALLASASLGQPATALAAFGHPGDRAPESARYIAWLQQDEAAIASAQEDSRQLAGQQPADVVARMVLNLEVADADYRYRQAVRREQSDLLQIASRPDVASAVVRDAPPDLALVVKDTSDAWYSIWSLGGIDEFNLVRIHSHPLAGAAPTSQLDGYYRSSASHYQLDWTYLASINFIESDFGRINGPSSAGAVGPMQFLPSTWHEYGTGDVNNPPDAIDAAARYLFLHGALRNIDGAIFAYNRSTDYVQAVEDYADLIRHNPSWLDRLYYWNTGG